MKNILTFLLLVTGLVNIVLFLFWLSLVHLEISGKDQMRYIYDNTATNITILQVIFGMVLFGTSITAIFWYHSVKDGAIANVSRLTEDYLKEKAPALIRQYVKESANNE